MNTIKCFLAAIFFAVYAADPHTGVWLYWRVCSGVCFIVGCLFWLCDLKKGREGE